MDASEHEKYDAVPATASAYLDRHYWDQRFAKEEHYEWFKDYSHFRGLILQEIEPSAAVLEVGCGNSHLCEELYRDGITELTCIDLSPVAVEKMKQRLSSRGFEEIKVLEADMLDLPFEDECFDVVIEKGTMIFGSTELLNNRLGSATGKKDGYDKYSRLPSITSFPSPFSYQQIIDVLFVDSGDPWNPEPLTKEKVMAMLQGVHRVLKPHGIFISITFGQPHFRRPFFNAPTFTWSVEWRTFGDGFHYFIYILKKGQRSSHKIEHIEKIGVPSITLFHEELDDEDYLFRTDVDGI